MGVDRATFKGFYCMVSPWMEFGSITCCMEKLDELGVQIPYARWVRVLHYYLGSFKLIMSSL